VKGKKDGPSTIEIKLRSDVDRMRREIAKLKKAAGDPSAGANHDAPASEADEAASA